MGALELELTVRFLMLVVTFSAMVATRSFSFSATAAFRSFSSSLRMRWYTSGHLLAGTGEKVGLKGRPPGRMRPATGFAFLAIGFLTPRGVALKAARSDRCGGRTCSDWHDGLGLGFRVNPTAVGAFGLGVCTIIDRV